MPRKNKERAAHRPHRIPQQARARATFDSILDAAERLLGKHGYAAVTTNHIADTAGVGIGSLYEYFPDKDAIVAEVARRTVDAIIVEIASGLLTTDPTDPRAALRAWLHAMFAAVGARRDIVRVLWREVPFLWELDEIRALPDRILALARQARRTDAEPPFDNLEAATFLLTVMVSQAVITTSIACPPPLTEQEVERTLVQMLEKLVFPEATPSARPRSE